MIRETSINESFIVKINNSNDVVQQIIDKYQNKCLKNIGVVNKIKEICIEPAQISGTGCFLKYKINLTVETIIPELNKTMVARAIKIYNDFTLFSPLINNQIFKNIKIAVSDSEKLEEGQDYNIRLLHFKFSNGNYNCIGARAESTL